MNYSSIKTGPGLIKIESVNLPRHKFIINKNNPEEIIQAKNTE